jgi:hypothetical protein
MQEFVCLPVLLLFYWFQTYLAQIRALVSVSLVDDTMARKSASAQPPTPAADSVATSTRTPTLESTSAAPSSTVAPEPTANLANVLRKRAQEEADGDILLTLNNLLQALEPVPKSSHKYFSQTSSVPADSFIPVVSDPTTLKSVEAALTELDQAVEAQRQRWHSQSGVPASDTDVPVGAEAMDTGLSEFEELGSGSVVADSHNPEALRCGDNAAGVDSSSKANMDVDEADIENVHVVDAQNSIPVPDHITSEAAVEPKVLSASPTINSSHLLPEDDDKRSLNHSTPMDSSSKNDLDSTTPPSCHDRHEAESSASPAASDASEVDLVADFPLYSDSASISDISSGSTSDLEDFVNVDDLPKRDVVLATPVDDGLSDQEDGWSDLEEAMPE